MPAQNENITLSPKDKKPRAFQRFKEIFSDFKWYDYAIVGVFMCAFWFLFFFTSDLWHTTSCSLAYDFGHFADFYDYNKALYTRLDYYPLIYVIYSIWNIPLAIMGIGSFAVDNMAILYYEKTLACLFMLGSAVPFYLICKKMGMYIKTAAYSTLVFLTTPYIFISIFGWGMYDSIGGFFLILGVYFFLREKKKSDVYAAMLIFGLAFSIKLFAAFVIIPMVAYRYKNLFKLAGLYLLSMVPVAIQMWIYGGSAAFTESAMGSVMFAPRLFGMAVGSSWHVIAIFVAAWAAVCLLAYFANYEPGNYIKPIYICMLAATVFLCCIEWHPQWFMILAPFSVLTTVAHKKRNRLYFFDAVFTCALLAAVASAFPFLIENVLRTGGLWSIFGGANVPDVSAVLIPDVFRMVFLGVLTAVLVISAVIKNPWKYSADYQVDFIPEKKNKLYVYARFLGPVAFFIAPMAIWAVKALI